MVTHTSSAPGRRRRTRKQSFEDYTPVAATSHSHPSDTSEPKTRPATRRRRQARPTSQTTPAAPFSNATAVDESIPEQEAWDFQFGDVWISKAVGGVLEGWGFTEPTPIQAAAIPVLLNGRDIVGQAQTGSGKTLAFGIPIAELLNPHLTATQAIVLVPTRELALQVGDSLRELCAARALRVAVVYGGEPIDRQFRQLRQGAHVVVGTPGRVMDHLRRGTLSLDAVSMAVLDEADEMLDIGFAEDIDWILRHTPRERQTALFSATIPGPIKTLIYKYLYQPEWIQVSAELQPAAEIEQIYFEVLEDDKLDALLALFEEHQIGQALVFRKMKRGVDWLVSALAERGLQAKAIHGDMSQSVRTRVMNEFRAGKIRILVATNVAARGLDIRDITHVVNFDVPDNAEEYVHRIGRTGRAGRSGVAFTFVGEWDLDAFDALREKLGGNIRQERLSLYG